MDSNELQLHTTFLTCFVFKALIRNLHIKEEIKRFLSFVAPFQNNIGLIDGV